MVTNLNSVTLTQEGVQVTIGATRPERTMGNLITAITTPKTLEGGGSGTTNIVNLRRIESRFNLDGYLATGLASSDTNGSAQQKASDIITMFESGNAINMVWVEGGAFSVVLEKMSVEHLIDDGTEAQDGEAEYVVKFTALRGSDLI